MHIFGIYIITVIVSFIMEIKIFKDAADARYKFNIERTVDIGNSIDTSTSKKNYLKLLIPIYNLAVTLNNYENYYNKRNTIFRGFEALGILEEMTDKEKEEYNKKRTGINAILIQCKYLYRIQNAATITLPDGSKIWYEYKKDDTKSFKDNITILKTEGRASYLSEEEQKEKIEKLFEQLAESIIKRYSKLEDFKFDLYSKEKINLDKVESKEETVEIIPEKLQEDIHTPFSRRITNTRF